MLAAAFGLLLLIALLQILLRNGFSTSLPGAEELLQTLVLWLAMLGALGATREGNHIRIDLLAQVLPGPWGQRLHGLSALATAGPCAFGPPPLRGARPRAPKPPISRCGPKRGPWWYSEAPIFGTRCGAPGERACR